MAPTHYHSLFQINTRVWLTELSRQMGRAATLDDIPDAELDNQPLDHFANNDGWCDDVSDGPVRALIQLKGITKTIEADSAWVIVAPADFAPPIENLITLYDIVYDEMAKLDPSLAIRNSPTGRPVDAHEPGRLGPIPRRRSRAIAWHSLCLGAGPAV
jgi:L-Lysine epsilon oxidase N-terminal